MRSPSASPTAPSGPRSNEIPGTRRHEMTFEEAAKELEDIVQRLERGDAGVDELTKLWERGEELYKICAEKLEGVQGKIEELARSTQTGDESG
jgi:exodeoxyribonuclease VII small subunit